MATETTAVTSPAPAISVCDRPSRWLFNTLDARGQETAAAIKDLAGQYPQEPLSDFGTYSWQITVTLERFHDLVDRWSVQQPRNISLEHICLALLQQMANVASDQTEILLPEDVFLVKNQLFLGRRTRHKLSRSLSSRYPPTHSPIITIPNEMIDLYDSKANHSCYSFNQHTTPSASGLSPQSRSLTSDKVRASDMQPL